MIGEAERTGHLEPGDAAPSWSIDGGEGFGAARAAGPGGHAAGRHGRAAKRRRRSVIASACRVRSLRFQRLRARRTASGSRPPQAARRSRPPALDASVGRRRAALSGVRSVAALRPGPGARGRRGACRSGSRALTGAERRRPARRAAREERRECRDGEGRSPFAAGAGRPPGERPVGRVWRTRRESPDLVRPSGRLDTAVRAGSPRTPTPRAGPGGLSRVRGAARARALERGGTAM